MTLQEQLDTFKNLDTLNGICILGRSAWTYANIRPKPKQSTTFGNGHAYTPQKVKDYVEQLNNQLHHNWSDYTPFENSVKLLVVFSFPFLKKETVERFKTTRPDVDNLMKPVQDSLKKLLKDDNQIVYPEVVKIHSENEFVFVKLIEIDYKGIK